MNTKRQAFDKAASAARDAHNDAQRELASDLAREFMNDPASFDPKRLIPLGRDGLLDVLRAVDEPDAAKLVVVPGRQNIGNGVSGATGWADLRRPEPHHWLRSVSVGVVTGACIIIIALASSMLLG
jgi:hypothetical protein